MQYRMVICLGVIAVLGGCGSIAKGVTEAILEKSDEKDTRACHIEGPASQGLNALLRNQDSKRAAGETDQDLKILMVHGIGKHLPGYSGRLKENLMRELGLNVREETIKEISLQDPGMPDQPLGELRIARYMNKSRTRDLIFYELTWSEIVEPEKSLLAFDDSGEHTFRRTAMNKLMKEFFNSHIPDPLIYLGEAQKPILTAVQQSICWMTSGDWQDYPDKVAQHCELLNPSRKKFVNDDLVFVTHSLGSRVVVDALQFVAEQMGDNAHPAIAELKDRFQRKSLPIYMLANQLPLLQLGRKPAEVHNQLSAYCDQFGTRYGERFLTRLSINAFSDPNDILSYAIPPKFVDDFMDSRLCPKVRNIVLNVAQPISIFGLGEFANPGEAHGGYDHDDRVIAIMANGFGHEGASPLVRERCSWIEIIDRG